MAVRVVTLDSGLLDSAIHALDLSVSSGKVGFGGAVLDAVACTGAIEHMHAQPGRRTVPARGKIAKLDSVVGEYRVNPVEQHVDQLLQERCGGLDSGMFFQEYEGELRSSAGGHEQI